MNEFAGSQWERAERITVAFELYTDVALTRDVPELGLRRGDVVKLVDHHDGLRPHQLRIVWDNVQRAIVELYRDRKLSKHASRGNSAGCRN